MSTQCKRCATVMLALLAAVTHAATVEGQARLQPTLVNAVKSVDAPAGFLSPRITAGSRPVCRGWWPASRRLPLLESFSFDRAPRDATAGLFRNLLESSPFPESAAAKSRTSTSAQLGFLLDLCNDTWDCGSAPRCDPFTECEVDLYRCEVNPRTGYRDCRHVGRCGTCRALGL